MGPRTPGATRTPDAVTLDSGWLTTDEPLGGWVKLVMNSKGEFTFSGHMHDSGFDNIEYVATAAAVTPSGIAYVMQHSGHTEGTSAGLPFGRPNRDDDWIESRFNEQIRNNWAEASRARLTARVVAKDKLIGGLRDMIEDVLKDALKELGKAAAAAVIALIV
jgi:hypothetical protein